MHSIWFSLYFFNVHSHWCLLLKYINSLGYNALARLPYKEKLPIYCLITWWYSRTERQDKCLTLSLFTSFQIRNRLCSICQWWLVNFIILLLFLLQTHGFKHCECFNLLQLSLMTIPSFASKELLQVDSYDTMTLAVFYCFHISMKWYSRLTLYISYPRSGISCFSKKTWFLSVVNG